MSNTIGTAIRLTVFGESHGPYIGGVIDGLPPGLAIDTAYIAKQMDKRRSVAALSTPRREDDIPQFISGVIEGSVHLTSHDGKPDEAELREGELYTEGTPLAFIIANCNTRSSDYDALRGIARPGHADFTAQARYDGYQDARGGGHFSGRLTAVMVAAGSVVRHALEQKGILIGSHISELNGIRDISLDVSDPAADIRRLNKMDLAVLDSEVSAAMQSRIIEAHEYRDSVGGILETYIYGLEAGIGEPLFGSVESELSKAVFSIGGVKGIEFGSGFEMARMMGSEANDAFAYRGGRAVTLTNHNGGINGGITNGMPIVFRTVIKPTPSIGKAQKTINFISGEETEIETGGRHDPAIIHRARVVVDSLAALVIADLACRQHGSRWLV